MQNGTTQNVRVKKERKDSSSNSTDAQDLQKMHTDSYSSVHTMLTLYNQQGKNTTNVKLMRVGGIRKNNIRSPISFYKKIVRNYCQLMTILKNWQIKV